ncbi:hypothetical protein TD95_003860 [Thielaviopsis punctulata]|uniref:Uncharacterized protein n=1 Tax=Thielaviopsis punctulata TaxID=72032 RepID=A0A0F4ZHN2_9PEZI|nr:hypothetical protein TD95_003860 [Thielaviopsis punctulata]
MDEKQRAEKLAAARKKAQQLKKAKKEKKEKEDSEKKEPEKTDAADTLEKGTEEPNDAGPSTPTEDPALSSSSPPPPTDDAEPPKPEALDTAAAASASAAAGDAAILSPTTDAPASSLAEQSKLRSTSFRRGSVTSPLSPGADGETAADIYRKQAARIEELERENKKLAKEAGEAEKRWKKAEEEVQDLREAEDKKGDAEGVEKLKQENEGLQRQIKQLQSQVSRRHGSSTSISLSGPPSAVLQEQLASKTATIESMEVELSNLRAQIERMAAGTSEKEQISALEEKLARAEKAASSAQAELADLKKNLDRTAEKAVREGSERISAETKIRAIETQLADELAARLEAEKRADALDKKIVALTTLHKENDARSQALRKEKDAADAALRDTRAKLERAEADAARLKARKSADGGGGLDDDGVDELEDEERQRLERKVRDMEAEISELRRGIWRDRRKSMGGSAGAPAGFHDVDLSGGHMHHGFGHARKLTGQSGGGLGGLLSTGLNVLAGGAEKGDDEDSFLSDDDEAGMFDEDAFRRAQAEEAAARLERVKEVKRGLKAWEGWRLDLVDVRKGVVGFGDVFEV